MQVSRSAPAQRHSTPCSSLQHAAQIVLVKPTSLPAASRTHSSLQLRPLVALKMTRLQLSTPLHHRLGPRACVRNGAAAAAVQRRSLRADPSSMPDADSCYQHVHLAVQRLRHHGASSPGALSRVPVQVIIDGPYGSPTQCHEQYGMLLLVGAGIGVTPLASVLRHLLHSFQTASPDSPARGPLVHSMQVRLHAASARVQRMH